MKIYVFLLIGTTLLLGCKKDNASSVNGPNVANNSTVREVASFSVNVDQVLGSWCTPENIRITGNVKLRIFQLAMPNGSTMVTVHQRFENIDGLGLSSGLHYMLIGQQMDVIQFKPTVGTKRMSTGKFTWKSPGAGKGTTFVNTVKLRWVVDENLVVRRDDSFFGLECR